MLTGVTVKHKGSTVQVPCEAQKVTVQALTQACGEPIKGLQSFVFITLTPIIFIPQPSFTPPPPLFFFYTAV